MSLIEDRTPWGDVGLDSLSMVELRNMLQHDFWEALVLSGTVLFDYPNLGAFVDYIDTSLQEVLSERRGGEDVMSVTLNDLVRGRQDNIGSVLVQGLACRLPGTANDVVLLWSMLKRRHDAMEEIPLRRMDWRIAFYADMQVPNKSYTNSG